MATYATGKSKVFTAECVTAKGFDDAGVVEHVADLVAHREELKRKKMDKAKADKEAQQAAVAAQQTPSETDSETGSASSVTKAVKVPKAQARAQSPSALKLLQLEDDKKYFMGEGLTVPKRGSHNSLIDLDV